MRIGIITWYSGINYGTHLQAIALQWYLREHGHETQLINYDESFKRYKKSIKQRIQNQPIKYFLKVASRKYRTEIEKRNQLLSSAIDEHCILSPKVRTIKEYIELCNSYDLIVVGSDQLWNPNWYSRIYYADYDEITTKRVAYAPSLGVNSIPSKIQDDMRRSLSKFNSISVREEVGAKLIESLGFDKPQVVVDPTLLLSSDEWKRIFRINSSKINEPYVLTLFLDDHLSHWTAASRFTNKMGMKHVIVPYMGMSYLRKGNIYADAGLEELMNLIQHAEYILTDSFHITVFYTFERFKENSQTSTNARVRNLLKITGLAERMISYSSNIIPVMEGIDYNVSSSQLTNYIELSKQFLKNVISD